ncbi:MAG TPA: type II secretion system protein GspL [Plasticicumulans sp.]|nr:type II secretion system protein GspL [Plasticicumulans sp.]
MKPAGTVIVRLRAAGLFEWQDGGGVHAGDAGAVAAALRRRRFVLAIDTNELLLTEVPRLSRQRRLLAQALPAALEEMLAEDIDELHFATGPIEERLAVAVLRRSRLIELLDAGWAAGLQPQAVLADVLLLPWRDGHWTLLHEDGQILLRCGRFRGYALSTDELPALLELLQAEIGTGAHERPRLLLHGDALPPATIPPDWQFSPQGKAGFWQICTDVVRDRLDLSAGLQLRPRAEPRNYWPVALLLGLWAGVHLYADWSGNQALAREEAVLQGRVGDLFRSLAPDIRRMVQPRVQLEQRLRERERQGGQETGLLGLLGALAPLLEAGDAQLMALSYREGSLDCTLSGGSLDQLENLRRSLDRAGRFSTQLQSAQRDGRVEGRLTIRLKP